MQTFVRSCRRHALAGSLVAALAAFAGRADVTITPGVIHGTVSFTADLAPTSMRVDAVNPPSEATRYPSTVTVASPCGGSGQTTQWCYSITVESALTHSYYVRPVFYSTVGNVSLQIALPEFPLPPAPLIDMPQNGDVTYDIQYQPTVVAGTTGLTDNGQPLPGQAFTLIAHDDDPQAQIFPDAPCGPSIGGNCLANSTVRTDRSTYELYLKPGRSYSIQKAFNWQETNPATGSYQFDFDLPYLAGAAGATDTRNYGFAQQASVSGTISINGNPLSAVTATVQGSTTTPLQPGFVFPVFASTYTNNSLGGATSSPYLGRVFSDADFTQPFSLLVDAYFADGSLVQSPKQALTLSPGQNLTIDYNAVPATIAGAVTFNPPRKLNSAPKTSLLHVGSNNFGLAQGYLTAQANGGTFSLPVIPDASSPLPYFSWQFLGIAFDLGPNFTSDYVIDGPLPLTPNLVVTQAGQTYQANLPPFDTAFVDVFFTAPAGTLISDPFLDAVLSDSSMASLGYALFETAHGEGLNQSTPALQAEAQLILRVDPHETAPFVITPSALVTQNGSTSRAPFSPFSVVPTPGGVIKVQPPLVLSVSSPTEGQQFDVCQIPVVGTAGGAPITGVTISIDGQAGVAAAIPASPIPGDPNRVAFSQTMAGVQGANSITVTATDAAKDTVSQTLHVSCAVHNQPPAIVCPEPVTNACGSSAGASQTLVAQVSDPDDAHVSVSWSVDGVAVKTDSVALAGGTGSDALAFTFSDASHLVQASVSDGVNPPVSCTTTVTISKDQTPPSVAASVSAALLWPPNHDLVNVGLAVSDADSCDARPGVGVGVFSNEADEEERGSGDFSPDAKDLAAGTLRLRSERKGDGNGRVYLVVATATDSLGEEGFDCATVVVPHDQSAASIALVNNLAASARAYCKAHGAAPAGYVPVGVGPTVGPKQ